MLDGVDMGALTKMVDAVRDDPNLAKVTFRANSQWKGGCLVSSQIEAMTHGGDTDTGRAGKKFTMTSDHPPSLLGGDEAPTPAEYLLQGLAGCLACNIVATAASRGIELESYSSEVETDFDVASLFLGITAGITAEQGSGAQEFRAKLKIVAPKASREDIEAVVKAGQERSPVTNTLARAAKVIVTLE
ncbi:MAG: OsmC family protein [Mycobacterium sp.]|nr:OsmC family protein [Mycobacterium sp.]